MVDMGERCARTALIASAVIAFLFSVAIAYPGVMTEDSWAQYHQAISGQYKDWHPPIMARLWSWLLPVAPMGSAFLILHQGCYWGGLGAIGDRLLTLGKPGLGFATLAIGLVPSSWIISLFVWKDVGMAVAVMAAFAIVFRARSAGSPLNPVAVIIVGLLLIYAILVRTNGIFAVVAVLLYAAGFPIASRPIIASTIAVVAILFAIGASTPINRHIFRATDAGGRFSLVIYDMVGVAHFSRDTAVFDKMGGADLAMVDHCYTPQLGDGIAHKECGTALGIRSPGAIGVAKFILRHPIAYAEHRILHFNEEMFLFVPRNRWHNYYKFDFFEQKWFVPRHRTFLNWHGLLGTVPVLAPALYLALALGIILLARPLARQGDRLAEGALVLAIAASVYALSFTLLGIAALARYQFFTLLAALVALLLYVAARRNGFTGVMRGERVLVGVEIILLVLIIGSRILL